MAKFFIFPFANIGDKVAIPDDVQPSGSVSYDQGFGPDYARNLASDPLAKPFPRSQFNQLMYDITNGIQQYQTHGTPDFIASSDNEGVAFAYDIYARVRYDNGSGYQIYENQVQGNTSLPTDSTWIKISGNSGNPPGTIIEYGGTTVPDGYLWCDGGAYSRTTYSALFAAIGTTWGSGDGSTTFNVPDFRRRVAMGSGGSSSAVISNTVGSIGGEEFHTLTIGEIPSHTHPGSTTNPPTGSRGCASGSGVSAVSDNGGSVGLTIAPQGDGGAHNNIQPSAVVLKAIKY